MAHVTNDTFRGLFSNIISEDDFAIFPSFGASFMLLHNNTTYEFLVDYGGSFLDGEPKSEPMVRLVNIRNQNSWDYNSSLMNYLTARSREYTFCRNVPKHYGDLGLFRDKLKKMVKMYEVATKNGGREPLGPIIKFLCGPTEKDKEEDNAQA